MDYYENRGNGPGAARPYGYIEYRRSPAPPPAKPPKKRKNSGTAVALVVLVALISAFSGGAAGWMAASSVSQQEAAQPADPAGETIKLSSTAEEAATESNANPVAAVAEKAGSSVVEIATEVITDQRFVGRVITEGGGSGVIYSADGYILTNNHVVEGARQIAVTTSDGTEYAAQLIGTDPQSDLAVVKIDASGLTPAEFADSSSLQVGELAVAIGNPLGSLGGTVTDGIISATERELTIEGLTMNLMQTSAAVNPGNSGGGLFNGDGKLIGIVNAKLSGSEIEGLAFAIPSNTAAEIATQLTGGVSVDL